MLVHGLWMNGMDMGLLRKRISKAGYPTYRFAYPSMRRCPSDNAHRLQTFAADLDAERVHYIAHSLGGLIIRHLFHLYPEQPPGNIITMGTPHQPSSAARQLMKTRAGRLLLGKSISGGLLGEAPPWRDQHHPLGVIAGSLRLGLGMVVPGIPRPSDGTVAVEETRLEGMEDHITLPVSHFGMLLSGRVAEQTLCFLRQGRFDHSIA